MAMKELVSPFKNQIIITHRYTVRAILEARSEDAFVCTKNPISHDGRESVFVLATSPILEHQSAVEFVTNELVIANQSQLERKGRRNFVRLGTWLLAYNNGMESATREGKGIELSGRLI